MWESETDMYIPEHNQGLSEVRMESIHMTNFYFKFTAITVIIDSTILFQDVFVLENKNSN